MEKEQKKLYCAEGNQYIEYSVSFVINLQLIDNMTTISIHILIIIKFVKDDN